ncbi:MAG: hypothetical protein EOP48_19430, partial [Sphingobacteriales bacterium]
MTINNPSLKETFHCVIAIQYALQKETSQVPRNKSHLDKLVPHFLINTYSLKYDAALNFVDNMSRRAYEGGVILLVAAFEKVVFAKYRTSYGNIKSVVNTHASKPMDFFASREKFINDSFDKLAAITSLLE